MSREGTRRDYNFKAGRPNEIRKSEPVDQATNLPLSEVPDQGGKGFEVTENLKGVEMDEVIDPDDPNFDYRNNTFVKPEIDLEEYFAAQFPPADFERLSEYAKEYVKLPEEVRNALELLSEKIADLPLIVDGVSRNFSEISVDVITKLVADPKVFLRAVKEAMEDNYAILSSLGEPARKAFFNYLDSQHAGLLDAEECKKLLNIKDDENDGEFKSRISAQSVAISEVFGLVVGYLTTQYARSQGLNSVLEESTAMAIGNYAACVLSYISAYLLMARKKEGYKFLDALKDAGSVELASTPWGFVQYGFQASVIGVLKGLGVEDPSAEATILGFLQYSGVMKLASDANFKPSSTDNKPDSSGLMSVAA